MFIFSKLKIEIVGYYEYILVSKMFSKCPKNVSIITYLMAGWGGLGGWGRQPPQPAVPQSRSRWQSPSRWQSRSRWFRSRGGAGKQFCLRSSKNFSTFLVQIFPHFWFRCLVSTKTNVRNVLSFSTLPDTDARVRASVSFGKSCISLVNLFTKNSSSFCRSNFVYFGSLASRPRTRRLKCTFFSGEDISGLQL